MRALPEPVTFPVTNFRFINVAEPSSFNDKYGFAVPWADLTGDVADVMSEQIMKAKANTYGLVNFSSNRGPRIYGMEPDNSDMIALHQRLHATNLSLDSVLIGMPGEVSVYFWAKDHNPMGTSPIGVGVSAIRFDPGLVKFPAFGEFMPHETPSRQ